MGAPSCSYGHSPRNMSWYFQELVAKCCKQILQDTPLILYLRLKDLKRLLSCRCSRTKAIHRLICFDRKNHLAGSGPKIPLWCYKPLPNGSNGKFIIGFSTLLIMTNWSKSNWHDLIDHFTLENKKTPWRWNLPRNQWDHTSESNHF